MYLDPRITALGALLLLGCPGDVEPCPSGEHRDGETCVPHTSCAPGELVVSEGTEEDDRVCAPCAAGTFSVEADAAVCTPWTDCAPGDVEATPGSATTDRACAPGEPWSLERTIDVYGLAWTGDTLLVSGDRPDGEGRVFAFGPGGDERWVTTLNPTPVNLDDAGLTHRVSVGSDGSIAVAAERNRNVEIHRLDAGGALIRTDTLTTASSDAVTDVLAEADGVVVAGRGFQGGDPSNTFGFLRQVLPDGSPGWGVSVSASGSEMSAVARGADGALFAAGWSGGQAIVRRYDGTPPVQAWSMPLGLDDTFVSSIVPLGDGFVVGALRYGESGFVRRYAADGSVVWTHTILATGDSEVYGVAVDAHGHVVVVGSTRDALVEDVTGFDDGFLRILDADGVAIDTVQSEHALVEVVAGAGGWVYVAELAGDYYSEGPMRIWSHLHP